MSRENEEASVETIDWEAESEMQKLLDLLPLVQQQNQSQANINAGASAAATTQSNVSASANADASDIMEFPSVLDVELCGWDLEGIVNAPSVIQNPVVGVF